ncbi:VOC family protein [Bacteriovoracaceae bacterium]|nr:VOC family protein [Bacteriovoracaceae bacterium]
MRPHLSIYVSNVEKTADFYTKVFGQNPQKQTSDYAKFDLNKPALNFTFMSSPKAKLSRVSHLGVEVDSEKEVREWKYKLEEAGVLTRDEMAVDCCYAHQDKIWFSDPDGNEWEVFFVKKQLDIPKDSTQTTCKPKSNCC